MFCPIQEAIDKYIPMRYFRRGINMILKLIIVKITEQVIKVMRGGENLSDTDSDWPRLEQLVLVYGGSQWSSDWIPGVKFPKQINK